MKHRVSFIREVFSPSGEVFAVFKLFTGSPKAAAIYLESGGDPGTRTIRWESEGYRPPPPPTAKFAGTDRPHKPVPTHATILTKDGPVTGPVLQCERHGVHPVTGLTEAHSPIVRIRETILTPEASTVRCDALSCCGERVGRMSTGVYV